MRPAFLITIDTEGDNLWACPREITTENSRYLPRFQQLCERHGFKPTWLTNWEMVECPVYRDFARDCLRRGTAEIGMHLHAWNNPPIDPLTADDFRWHPYLTQFSERLMRDKIATVTHRLEEVFGTKMLSHRAGRWAFNETYARLLVEFGYRVDCSVSPHIRWQHEDPQHPDVVDYRHFPEQAYWLDLNDISKPASPTSSRQTLLELPVTIQSRPRTGLLKAAESLGKLHSLPRRVLDRVAPTKFWLRPDGRNDRNLINVVREAIHAGHDYVEFMLHSSEFMPGCSPRFPTANHIERLYHDLETLFAEASQLCDGLTLAEYSERFSQPSTWKSAA